MPSNPSPPWYDNPRRRRQLFALAAVLLLGLLGFSSLVDFLADLLWFASQGYPELYWLTYGIKLAALLLGGAAYLLLLLPNLALAQRLSRSGPRWAFTSFNLPPAEWAKLQQFLRLSLWVLTLLGTLVASRVAGDRWQTILMWWQRQPFGISDPLFQQDVGFYVFTLPFLQDLLTGLILALFAALVASLLKYIQNQSLIISLQPFLVEVLPAPRRHLVALGTLILLVGVGLLWLSRYQVLFAPHGLFWGAGYAEAQGSLRLYPWITIIALAAVVLFGANYVKPRLRPSIMGLAGVVVIAILGLEVYPNLLHYFYVKPNELTSETPYLRHNIRFTRLAYDLERIQEIEFPVRESLSGLDLAAHQGTLTNIKVWDKRPLLLTYRQLQEIRPYYEFPLVAVDRYPVGGSLRQVMLAPRELAAAKLPAESRTWVNERLKFTHGYGACVSPVNRVTESGLPEFWLQDLPPSGRPEFALTRPEIYFGMLTRDYVLVNSGTEEFDFPAGDENRYTRYQGRGGVELSSFGRRLLMAAKFKDLKIILSGYITPTTRVLWRRHVMDMVRTLAPFLAYEEEPYPVISQGRLYWILDAYTLTSRYPYATPYRPGQSRFNYLRNSVKVVVDAYDGSVDFYLMDAAEPLAAAWRQLFPRLFKPIAALPPDLKQHLRYPKDLFHVQGSMLRTYHMRDPQVFYNREDQWEFPSEIYEDKETPLTPQYMVMRLPGVEREEFLLMLPYTPTRKANLVSWLVARCDWPDYGQMRVYTFSKDKLIYGPLQVEARIDQDPDISSLLTLWGQKGSRVLRGDLMVIPVQDSLLYIEPIYLVATQSQMPELKKVVAVNGPRLAMADTLEEAVKKVFSVRPAAATPTTPRPAPATAPSALDSTQALRHLRQAQEYLKTGDWAGFGQEMQKLQGILERSTGSPP